jgi:hypothetical protein
MPIGFAPWEPIKQPHFEAHKNYAHIADPQKA